MRYKLVCCAAATALSVAFSPIAFAQSDEAAGFYKSALESEWLEGQNQTTQILKDKLKRSPDQVWTNVYDSNGNHLSIEGPDASVASSRWTDASTKQIINAVGLAWEFVYDQEGRLLSRKSPNGVVNAVEYNSDGMIVSLTTSGKRKILKTSYVIGEEGYLTSVILPSGREVLYDSEVQSDIALFNAARQNLGVFLESDQLDTYASDVAPTDFSQILSERLEAYGNEFLEDEPGEGTSRLGTVEGSPLELDYNEYGFLSRVEDPRGIITTYNYDGFRRVVQEISPESGAVTYDRNAAGHIVRESRNGELEIFRKYDAIGRILEEVTKRTGVDDAIRTFSYDQCRNGASRLCSIESPAETTTFEYNGLGHLAKRTTKYRDSEGQQEITTFSHDKAGRLKRVGYPSGVAVLYQRNSNGHVRSVSLEYNGFERVVAKNIDTDDASGRPSRIVYGNNLRTRVRFNEKGLLQRAVTRDGDSAVASAAYEYDDAERIVVITREDAALSQSFSYDLVGRLVMERRGDPDGQSSSLIYEYDESGNRISLLNGEKRKRYTYESASNRVATIGRRDVTFDSMGNMIADKDGKRSFVYDGQNRMAAFYKDGVLRAQYVYDAFGRRIQKTLNRPNRQDKFRDFNATYLPDGRLLGEVIYDQNGIRRFSREYVWVGSLPVAQVELAFRHNGELKGDPKLTYIHHDHRNMPLFATDEDKRIVWKLEATAFGVGKADMDPDRDGEKVDIALRMPGQYYDKESKLFYNGQRDYDPSLGRYIQADPAGLLAGINRYAYVKSDPVNNIDPTGLDGGTTATVITIIRTARLVYSLYRFFKSIFGGSSTPKSPIKTGPTYEPGYYTINMDCREPGVTCSPEQTAWAQEIIEASQTVAALSLDKKDAPEEEGYCSIYDLETIVNRDQDVFFRLRLVKKKGDRLFIYPRSVSLPDVSIQNTPNGDGFSTFNRVDHVYNHYEKLDNLNMSPARLGDFLAKYPTPNHDHNQPGIHRTVPANTTYGSRNDVGKIARLLQYQGGNWVRSFRIKSPQPDVYTDIVLNYTIKGQHLLFEGYVMRTGVVKKGRVDGIRTYGEGEGLAQQPALIPIWCPQVPDVWEPLNLKIIRDYFGGKPPTGPISPPGPNPDPNPRPRPNPVPSPPPGGVFR